MNQPENVVKHFSNAWRKPAVLAERGTTGWRHVLEKKTSLLLGKKTT
jgi:hypothetical protein